MTNCTQRVHTNITRAIATCAIMSFTLQGACVGDTKSESESGAVGARSATGAGSGARTFTVAATEVAVGRSHDCWLARATGGVLCRGSNSHGQLGRGGSVGGDDPVPAPVASSEWFVSVTAGALHTCALTDEGHVYCWGQGLGGAPGSTLPQRVSSFTAIQVTSGTDHVCAIRQDRRAVCWGAGTDGQLGNGSSVDQPGPVLVVDSLETQHRFLKLDAGPRATCGIRTTNDVVCWGANDGKQLVDSMSPAFNVPVDFGDDAVDVAVGNEHTCVLRFDSRIGCRGNPTEGRLGSFAIADFLLEGTTAPPASLTAGDDHTCASTNAGSTYCWGANDQGQLGHAGLASGSIAGSAASPPYADSGTRALRVTSPSDLQGVVAGERRTCALSAGTSPFPSCWGRTTPTEDAALAWLKRGGAPASIDLGVGFGCAVNLSGQVLCWGRAGSHLGTVGASERHNPITVTGLPAGRQFLKVDVGDNSACALDDQRELWCWGEAELGQLGVPLGGGATASGPRLARVNVVDFSVGRSTVCAVEGTGSVVCWGEDAGLKNGAGDGSAAVTLATGTWKRVAISGPHGCISDASSRVACWGTNWAGQIGQPLGVASTATPTNVAMPPGSGGPRTFGLAAGDSSTCAFEAGPSNTEGTVFCWGGYAGPATFVPIDQGVFHTADLSISRGNRPCIIGYNSFVSRPSLLCHDESIFDGFSEDGTAATVGFSSTQPLAVATAERAVCIINAEGSLMCSGDIQRSERAILGRPSGSRSPASGLPLDGQILTETPLNGAVQTAAGEEMTCELSVDGTVSCWGRYWESGVQAEDWRERVVMTRAMSIALGTDHACAVTELGEVHCWGSNSSGQIKLDPLAPATPEDLPQLTWTGPAYQIALGDGVSCALKSESNELLCWGDSTIFCSGTPLIATDLMTREVMAMDVGNKHGCFIEETEGVFCFGENGDNQVGPPSGGACSFVIDSDASPSARISEVAAGARGSCALEPSGDTTCWGFGDAVTSLDGSSSVHHVTMDGSAGCLLTEAGGRCVLRAPPVATFLTLSLPTRREERLAQLAPSYEVENRNYVCGQLRSGARTCFGFSKGGSGMNIDAVVPEDGTSTFEGFAALPDPRDGGAGLLRAKSYADFVFLTPRWLARRPSTSMAISGNLGTALITAGQASEWGALSKWRGAEADAPTPSVAGVDARTGDGGGDDLAGLPAPTISVLADTYCVVDAHSDVLCWGYNRHGQTGSGFLGEIAYPPFVPMIEASYFNAVQEPTPFQDVSGNGLDVSVGMNGTTCVLTNAFAFDFNNTLRCVGRTDDIQFADPAAIPPGYAVEAHPIDGSQHIVWPVEFDTQGINPIGITVGWAHACFLGDDTRVYCFGSNQQYQHGTGDDSPYVTPRPVVEVSGVPLSEVVEVEAGVNLTCARTASGETSCWGDPAAYPFLSTMGAVDMALSASTRLTVADDHALAISKGEVYSWGVENISELPLVSGLAVTPTASGKNATDLTSSRTAACLVTPALGLTCYSDDVPASGHDATCPSPGCADVVYP